MSWEDSPAHAILRLPETEAPDGLFLGGKGEIRTPETDKLSTGFRVRSAHHARIHFIEDAPTAQPAETAPNAPCWEDSPAHQGGLSMRFLYGLIGLTYTLCATVVLLVAAPFVKLWGWLGR